MMLSEFCLVLLDDGCFQSNRPENSRLLFSRAGSHEELLLSVV